MVIYQSSILTHNLFFFLHFFQSKASATEEYEKLRKLVKDKEEELNATREVATREIEELKTRLSFANK